jgi:Glycosyltransferase family 87
MGWLAAAADRCHWVVSGPTGGGPLEGTRGAAWRQRASSRSLRTIYLGQVNLILMALIIWDAGQPGPGRGGRWWRGAGVGIAAGIKLVPLIFIPYLLLTRRPRSALVACATFAATVLCGFVVLLADSARWWLGGLFLDGGRTGFLGWAGNQSLRALLTRLAGSVAGAGPVWLGWRWSPRWPGWPARPSWTGPGTGCPGCWPAR